MAQLLSILALSFKVMTEKRLSMYIELLSPSLADYGSEAFLKKLIGRTEVEDALSRLDKLTKEECSMVMARNLEIAHHVDGNVKAARNGA